MKKILFIILTTLLIFSLGCARGDTTEDSGVTTSSEITHKENQPKEDEEKDTPDKKADLLRELSGCEWLTEITADDVTELKIITEYVGVAPGNLKNIFVSKDAAVIKRIFDDYCSLAVSPIARENGLIAGGSSTTVVFILSNGEQKVIRINNGNYRTDTEYFYKLEYTPNFSEGDSRSSRKGFIAYNACGKLYDSNKTIVCEIPIEELEFDYDVDLDLPDLDPYDYTLQTIFGDLTFIAPSIFYTESGAACVLVDTTLDELILKYTAATN